MSQKDVPITNYACFNFFLRTMVDSRIEKNSEVFFILSSSAFFMKNRTAVKTQKLFISSANLANLFGQKYWDVSSLS